MSDDAVFFPRKLVKQFILKYKELECLWNPDCAAYRVKIKRHQAITQLTKLVQTYEADATRVHILRKIDSLRACMRREYKKVQDSKLVATREEDVYIPNLWYYPLFSFLIKQDQKRTKAKSNQKDEGETSQMLEPVDSKTSEASDVLDYKSFEDEQQSSEEEVEEDIDDRAFSPQPMDIKPEPTYEADCDVYEQIMPTTSKRYSQRMHLKRTRPRGSDGPSGIDDEYDAIGMNVAAKLRYLPENMRILAEKLIGDVLFQAQTNGLTASSVLTTPDPFH